jgi:hypothetical protein
MARETVDAATPQALAISVKVTRRRMRRAGRTMRSSLPRTITGNEIANSASLAQASAQKLNDH